MDSQASAASVGLALSPLQVALAIAILKTKPAGLTARGYILQLRQHLRSGKRSFHADEEHHRHLDQVAFWRARYDESQQRCQELERRNIQLERWQLSDETSSGYKFGFDEAEDTRPTKRKRAGTKSGASRRAKHQSSDMSESSVTGPERAGHNSASDATEILDNGTRKSYIFPSDADEVSRARDALVEKVYTTHKLYKQQTVNEEALCFSLVETTRAIASLVATVPNNYEKLAAGNLKGTLSLGKDKSEFAAIILASSRAWASLLLGLQKLGDGSDNHLPSVIVFECVKMFNVILQSIADCARDTARVHSFAVSKGSKGRSEASTTPRETAPFRSMAQFLNALIANLNKDDKHHRDIFEGMLFLLLERTGKLLFYFTFDRHRSATIEGDIMTPEPKDVEQDVRKQATTALASRLEAQCLAAVLDRAIGLAPYHMNAPPQSRPSSSSNRRPSTASRSPSRTTSTLGRSPSTKTLPRASAVPLVAHAKDKLQRTLVQSMFGEEEHDEFADVLRRPGVLGPMPKMSKVEDNDVRDWFSKQIWKLVGWELLSTESVW